MSIKYTYHQYYLFGVILIDIFRGHPVSIPRASDHSYYKSDKVLKRLAVPLTGLAMIGGSRSMEMFAVNVVGDVFKTEVEKAEARESVNWPDPILDTKVILEKVKRFEDELPKENGHFKIAKMVMERDLPDLSKLTVDVQRSPKKTGQIFIPRLRPMLVDDFDHQQDINVIQVLNGEDIHEDTLGEIGDRVQKLKGVNFSKIERHSRPHKTFSLNQGIRLDNGTFVVSKRVESKSKDQRRSDEHITEQASSPPSGDHDDSFFNMDHFYFE